VSVVDQEVQTITHSIISNEKRTINKYKLISKLVLNIDGVLHEIDKPPVDLTINKLNEIIEARFNIPISQQNISYVEHNLIENGSNKNIINYNIYIHKQPIINVNRIPLNHPMHLHH